MLRIMELSGVNREIDPLQGIEVAVPATESFLDPSNKEGLWPEEVVSDPAFAQQLEAHREVSRHLDEVLECLPGPTTTLESAIKQGYLTESQVEKLYLYLSDLLANQDYTRLALYLPFEFLPDKTWSPSSESLRRAIERFKAAYIKAWESLLIVQDVRANFVDGDVLEVEQRTTDLPRVVKAGHLIPKLVEKGLLDIPEVLDLLEETRHPVLKSSIGEALQVLQGDSEDIAAQPKEISFAALRQSLDEVQAQLDSEDFRGLTQKRIAWIKYKRIQAQIDTLAQEVSTSIKLDILPEETIANILSYEADNLTTRVLIEGIQKAIESAGLDEPQRAGALYDKYHAALWELWETDDPEVKNLLVKSFRRLYPLGLVDSQQLAEVGITLPALSGNLSANLELIPEQIDHIKNLVAVVEADPELSSLIYPAFLVYGSRLKGYGEANADIDLGVFVKPGTAPEERTRLRQLLGGLFGEDEKDGAIEFWLDELGEQLKVHDFTDMDALRGDSSWAHTLFNAAWVGNTEVVSELRQKVLSPYFYETEQTIYGREARGLWLEEIERDTLQYRLMHLGYQRHYPAAGGINSLHAGDIDGKSMFWDSGYRQMATKLFIEKVFLPKIPAAR